MSPFRKSGRADQISAQYMCLALSVVVVAVTSFAFSRPASTRGARSSPTVVTAVGKARLPRPAHHEETKRSPADRAGGKLVRLKWILGSIFLVATAMGFEWLQGDRSWPETYQDLRFTITIFTPPILGCLIAAVPRWLKPSVTKVLRNDIAAPWVLVFFFTILGILPDRNEWNPALFDTFSLLLSLYAWIGLVRAILIISPVKRMVLYAVNAPETGWPSWIMPRRQAQVTGTLSVALSIVLLFIRVDGWMYFFILWPIAIVCFVSSSSRIGSKVYGNYIFYGAYIPVLIVPTTIALHSALPEAPLVPIGGLSLAWLLLGATLISAIFMIKTWRQRNPLCREESGSVV